MLHPRTFRLLLPLLLLGLALWVTVFREGPVPSQDDASVNPGTVPPPASSSILVKDDDGEAQARRERAFTARTELAKADAPFRIWLGEYRAATSENDDPETARLQAVGVRLAQARREAMISLIQNDPELALEKALRLDEYAALPEEIRALVEEPFSQVAPVDRLHGCDPLGPNASTIVRQVRHPDAGVSRSHVFGDRLAFSSKEDSPVNGIRLDGHAALRPTVFHPLDPREIATATGLFPDGQHDPTACLASAQPLGPDAVTALAGGRLYRFQDRATLEVFDARTAALEEQPGIRSGARHVLLQAAGGTGNDPSDIAWEAVFEDTEVFASSWTETRKDVFIIRIDFSDDPGASVSQVDLETVLNGATSSSILEQSYGKTWIDGEASAMVVRMPSPTSTYLPSNNDLLRDDAIAAFNALGTGINLGDYDIVGVHFASIGMMSGGVTYAGLAGGSRIWLQNTTNPEVIIHEFGHNYGLGHASFWDPSTSNPVGPGSNVEYGDIYDIMGDGPQPQGHFHQQAKSKLNWITTAEKVDISGAGTMVTHRVYRIDHEDTATANIKGLKVTKGADEYYWIGYRRKFPGNQWLEKGAYLVWERPGFSRSWLVDTTPGSMGSDDERDGPISLGRTYSDTTADVHITPVAIGGASPDEWIDVTVNIGPFPGNAAPTVSISGPTSVNAREPYSYTATASDPNGDTLAYDWDFGDADVSDNASSVSKTWAVGGSYTVTVTVSDMKGLTASDTITVTVTDPLETWTQQTSGTSANLNAIATDGNVAVAVGESSGTHRRSTDGITWTGGTIGINRFLHDVVHTGTEFLAVGQNYNFGISDWVGVIYASADGSSWTLRKQIATGNTELNAIATSGTVHLVGGDAGRLERSTNGTSWTQVMVPELDGTRAIVALAYGNGTFLLAARNNGGSGNPLVMTSSDGLSWTDVTTGSGLASWHDLRHAEFFEGKFLANGWYSKMRYSNDDGATFQSNLSDRHEGPMAFGNCVYVMTGINRDDGNADINLISSDGESWTPITPPNQGGNDRNGLVFFKDHFISVGDSGAIWRSGMVAPCGLPNDFTTWLTGHGYTGTPDSDTDMDGVPAGVEFAFDLDPGDGSDGCLVPKAMRSGNTLTLSYTEPASAPVGVVYGAEESSDLLTWYPLSDTGSGTTHTFSTTLTTDQVFIRHKILVTP